MNSEPKGLIPSSPFGRGITTLCSNWCRLQGPLECPAYTLDYSTNQCTVLSRPADTALSPAGVQGRSYFEQVCFSSKADILYILKCQKSCYYLLPLLPSSSPTSHLMFTLSLSFSLNSLIIEV